MYKYLCIYIYYIKIKALMFKYIIITAFWAHLTRLSFRQSFFILIVPEYNQVWFWVLLFLHCFCAVWTEALCRSPSFLLYRRFFRKRKDGFLFLPAFGAIADLTHASTLLILGIFLVPGHIFPLPLNNVERFFQCLFHMKWWLRTRTDWKCWFHPVFQAWVSDF